MSIAEKLEAKIRQNRLLNLPVHWQDEVIFPYYNGLSLRNVPHTVASLLGAPLPDSSPLQDDIWQANPAENGVDRVVLFLMDGMGYKHLNMLMAEDEAIREAVADINNGREVIPLTSVAPSTTAVALTTLWTGGTPAETGMLGTFMFLREFHTIGDMLSFRPVKGNLAPDTFTNWGAKPSDLVAKRGLCEHLTEHNIESHLVLDRNLTGTGLSRILHRGVTHRHLHNSYSDALLRMEDALIATRGKRAYVNIYWAAVDTLAHSYGAHNRYTHTEIRNQLCAIRDLLNKPEIQDGRTVFILLADHGHYDAPKSIDVNQDSMLRDAMLIGLNGDARLPYLFLHSGTEEKVRQHIEQNYADSMTYIPRGEALSSGFFGDNIAPKSPARIGDLTLVPRLGWTIQDPTVATLPLISWHAGLSDWEMLIPFMWKRI